MIFATVLRGGREYTQEHVHKLRDMVQQHAPNMDFVCLTDSSPQCNRITLTKNYPGWWAKMELFKLQGPVLYMDLDTIICGDISHWLDQIKDNKFVILRDVYRDKRDPHAMQSSIMYWSGDMSDIWEEFSSNPDFSHPNGDQGWLEQHLDDVAYIQDFTDDVVSYKAHIKNGYPKHKATVIFFHGKPRPWEQRDVAY